MMEKVEEMIQAAREGSMEAFDWLYKATYNRNYYIVLKMVKQEQDVMDILQDTYVKVFQNLSSFRYTGSKSFGSWTGKIASNTALDFLRKKQPRLFSDLQVDGEEDELELEFADESIENQPDLALDQKETSRIVQEMLECLSEEQRICIIFRYIRQMKISEIARECSCSENTVKSRLNYAKKRLSGERETLEKKGIRLYNIAPFTIFVFLLQEDAKAACVPPEVSGVFARILEQAFDAQNINSFYPKGSGKISAGVKMAAGHGMGKAAAVAVASLLAVGTGGFLLNSLAEETASFLYAMETEDSAGGMEESKVQADSGGAETEALEETDKTEGTSQEEPGKTEEISQEEESVLEEEIYYEYLNQVLIPEYGLADLHQEGTMTMDYSNPDSRSSKENEWFEPKGIVSSYIDDLDLDGQKELFVIYWEKFTAFFQRKGLDVSELVEHLEDFGDENMGELTHTENVITICTLNSIWGEHSDDAGKSTAQVVFEGTDWTNLREHAEE